MNRRLSLIILMCSFAGCNNNADPEKPSVPIEPFDHPGEPKSPEEKFIAAQVRDGVAALKLKKEVEFLAWGPHDLDGSTANVLKTDRYAVFRVRYAYQQEGAVREERDELWTLTYAPADSWQEIDEKAKGFGLPRAARHKMRSNSAGGPWLQEALRDKKKRETD